MEFIQRFNKLYNKIPVEVKPSQPAAKVTFAGAFKPDFTLLLRERRGDTLTRMKDNAIEIEYNMMALGKLKTKLEMGNGETEKPNVLGNKQDPQMIKWMIWLGQLKRYQIRFLEWS
jgi:hypothetical protein